MTGRNIQIREAQVETDVLTKNPRLLGNKSCKFVERKLTALKVHSRSRVTFFDEI